MTKGGGSKIWQRYLTLANSHLYPHSKTVNMFGFIKRKNSDIQGDWTGGSRLWRAFNNGQKSIIRCFFSREISYVASYARIEGGVAKKWRMMTRGRGGGYDTPQKWWRHLWTAPYYNCWSLRELGTRVSHDNWIRPALLPKLIGTQLFMKWGPPAKMMIFEI